MVVMWAILGGPASAQQAAPAVEMAAPAVELAASDPAPVSAAVTAAAAPAAPVANQCNPPAFPTGAGQEITCDITIQNSITAQGATQSTVTATACLGAAGVGPPVGCTTTVTTSNQLVTAVNQCNGVVTAGGSNVTCNVRVINTIPVGTTTSGVTVNQCNGSGMGGGTQPTVACDPTGTTPNATVEQCNSSGNGGGAAMRVKCTVTGAVTASPVTIAQCNGSANGGGATVTCTATVSNNFITTASPSLTINKSATPTTVNAVGQIVTYQFLVTNTGNVTLTNITVADTQTAPAGPLTTTPACLRATGATGPSLDPAQMVTCTATYTVTQADLNNGSVADSAVATGTSPAGTAVLAPASTVKVMAMGTAGSGNAAAGSGTSAGGSGDDGSTGNATSGGATGATSARGSGGPLAATGLALRPLLDVAVFLLVAGLSLLAVAQRRRCPQGRGGGEPSSRSYSSRITR